MRIDRIELVSCFKPDAAILLSQGPRLQQIASQFKAKVIQLPTPELAPPELPRVVLKAEQALLQIGLNRFQVIVEPPTHVRDSYVESMKFAEATARVLLKPLLSSPTVRYQWSGVIAQLSFPSSPERVRTGIAAAAPLFGRLVNVSWPLQDLASFELQCGFRTEGYFRTYTLTGYELREIERKVSSLNRPVSLDMSTGKLVEVGISLTLDVNNKPLAGRAGTRGLADLTRVLRQHVLAFETLSTDLNLEGLLS